MTNRIPGMRELSRTVIQEKFSEVHPVWVESHLKLLCSLRSTFGSDLDKPIILGVIGQRMFQHSQDESKSYSTALKSEGQFAKDRMTNVESISLATGIPRETVRRKVAELIEVGWVEKGSNGRLWVTMTAAVGLDDSSKIIFEILESVFAVIASNLPFEQRLYIE